MLANPANLAIVAIARLGSLGRFGGAGSRLALAPVRGLKGFPKGKGPNLAKFANVANDSIGRLGGAYTTGPTLVTPGD